MYTAEDLDDAYAHRNGTREILNEKYEAFSNAQMVLEQATLEYEEAKENDSEAGQEAWAIMQEIEQNRNEA